jgi:hypothetical protein
MENSSTGNVMGLELWSIITKDLMKEIGSAIISMEKGFKNFLTVALTKVIILMENQKAWVDIHGQMDNFIKDSG